MPKAVEHIVMNAPIEKVFSVIVDYNKYPEFLSDMKDVVTLSRQDGVAVVRFDLELIMKVSYTLRLVEDSPTKVRWTLEQAKVLSENTGGWLLESLGEGQTRATYDLEVKLRGLIPKSVSTKLLGTTLPETLQRFKTRAERMS